MKSVRSAKTYYIAAFILGALIALIVISPARSAEPFRLDRMAVVRFSGDEGGAFRRNQNMSYFDGRVLPRGSLAIEPAGANVARSDMLLEIHPLLDDTIEFPGALQSPGS